MTFRLMNRSARSTLAGRILLNNLFLEVTPDWMGFKSPEATQEGRIRTSMSNPRPIKRKYFDCADHERKVLHRAQFQASDLCKRHLGPEHLDSKLRGLNDSL